MKTMVELLGERLAVMITTPEQEAMVREVYDIIGDERIAGAWILGMNPFLSEQSPLMCICDGIFWAVRRAALVFDEGTVNL